MHETVLLDEAVDSLNIKADGRYVDATFGRGGHSNKILSRLNGQGQLLVIDQDPMAIEQANELAQEDARVIVQHGPFETLREMIKVSFDSGVDGILFDLGVSSPQLDEAERGFSFSQTGPLDMRMDTSGGETAAQWLNQADWKDISKVLWRYGEEKNATKIAKEIVIYRDEVKPLETTAELVGIIEKINKYSKKHPATRSFQAIRIYINRELVQVENVLPESLACLNNKGRLVVISFHSLEDRLVKRFFKKNASQGAFDKRMPIAIEKEARLKIIGKPVKASKNEIENNPRSRSAIMRVAEKT